MRHLLLFSMHGVFMLMSLLVCLKCGCLNDTHKATVFMTPVSKCTRGYLFFSVLSACSFLCGGSTGAAPGSKCTLSSSLMYSVMKLASAVAPDNSPIQKLSFSLLANLAMSRDCRGLLQKVKSSNTVYTLLWTRQSVQKTLGHKYI